jgi:hypothetical protein
MYSRSVAELQLGLQIRSNLAEFGEGGLEAFHDFGGDDVGIGKVGALL